MDVEGGQEHEADPGWNFSSRMLLGVLYPPLLMPPGNRDGTAAHLSLLRQVFVAFAASPVLFLPILAIILPLRDPASSRPSSPWDSGRT